MATSSFLPGIKNLMQKEIFEPEEKLKSLISVAKLSGRSKKKHSFITLTLSQHGNQTTANLGRVKVLDKKESSSTFKRVKTWPVSELRVVDCHQDGSELDFKFDRQIFKWVVVNMPDKRPFIVSLYRVVRKYYDHLQIRFMNFDTGKLESVHSASGTEVKTADLEDTEEILDQEEYRELTAQEEADLEALLGRENAIQDAASFMENLSEELAQLDQSNIHALMGSEEQIEKLMEYLEGGIAEVEKMEMRLTVYDELLSGVRVTMQNLSSQYSHILRQNTNLKALCTEVDAIISKLDLEPQVAMVLQECPLGSRTNIQDCVTAAKSLQKALCQQLSQGLTIIQAVTDQTKFFSDLSSSFGKRLQEYLVSQFVSNASTMMEVRQTLVSHSHVHNDLLLYQDLTKWLKECLPDIFAELKEAYIRSFKHVYEDQLRNLLSESRIVLQHGRHIEGKKSGAAALLTKLSTSTSDIRTSLSGSMGSLSPARGSSSYTQSVMDLASSSESVHGGILFDKVFPVILDQIQPICVAERRFLNAFFHFERQTNNRTFEEGMDGEKEIEELDRNQEGEDIVDAFFGRRREEVIQEMSGDLDGPMMLNQLFGSLLRELEEFIDFAERLDSYNALYLLVFVSQRLMFAFESGGALSYLDETLKKALLHIRRIFDKFIDERVKMIQESKEFAERSERIVMGTDRRTELDKAYVTLTDVVFATLERLAHEHPRTPHDVIKFENYNKVVDILSRLKIVCLDARKDEARKRYRCHKNEYVNNCLGRPMDKLSAFFEGVQSLRASGVKAEEIGYRLEFSKNELRKCIREYPGKEVKRGLEKLYRRVEKEVSEGELQVVWGSMQSAFIQQCQKFQSLIAECYPGSNITLEFSIGNISEYFMNISKQN